MFRGILKALVLGAAMAAATPAFSTPASPSPNAATPAQIESLKTEIMAFDRTVFTAWRSGDSRRLASVIDDDARLIDGLAPAGQQWLTKAQFVEAARTRRLARTVALTDHAARIFGFTSDVAIVNGVVEDRSDASYAGGVYTAVYEKRGRAWRMVAYEMSPLAGTPPQQVLTPGEPWAADSLSPAEMRVVETMRTHFDAMTKRNVEGFTNTIGDDFWYVHGNIVSGTQRGKAEYVPYRTRVGGPGLIALGRPQVVFYGRNKDVAVVTGIRRDADGGARFGQAIPWRNLVYYITVARRTGTELGDPAADTWVLEHYQGTFIKNPS